MRNKKTIPRKDGSFRKKIYMTTIHRSVIFKNLNKLLHFAEKWVKSATS